MAIPKSVPHLMSLPSQFISQCAAARDKAGYVALDVLFSPAIAAGPDTNIEDLAIRAARLFNGPVAVRHLIRDAARNGDQDAANLAAWMSLHDISPAPVVALPKHRAAALEKDLLVDPTGYLSAARTPYPYSVNDQHWGFDPAWVNTLLDGSRARLEKFITTRTGNVAVLVGNGPSLNQTDLTLLAGTDTYITNYAVKHPVLSAAARGVAVSNYFVASQEPEAFFDLPYWRVLPVGLSHVLADDPNTIWLNALGGPLFFSQTPQTHIAWHATVSYFWMQVLLAAGYTRLLLIGVDNSYQQPHSISEGTVLHQTEDDPNHFDSRYFKGKLWQAANTDHMAQTYVLAKHAFEQAGAEIVNCTVGGALEVFRRSPLETGLKTKGMA